MKEPTRHRIDFNLYLISDRRQARSGNLLEVVEEALKGGVKAVQLREKDVFSRDLYEMAHELRKLTSRYGAGLFINDRLDIALAVDADGIHLGGDSLPIYKARALLGENKLLGVSCHNQVSAITAQEKGADFITFGPVFYTPSKAPYGDPVGLAKLADVTKLLEIPVFALGGINRNNARQVIAAGAHGIALISAIIADEKPRQETEMLLSLLPATGKQED
ncbi:MAG: thiamine-phosphate [Geobacteraceae bacterium]|nr:MAG: thiamine-phosphate [Geobacteraceae bacterium]